MIFRPFILIFPPNFLKKIIKSPISGSVAQLLRIVFPVALNAASIALFSQWLELDLLKRETSEYAVVTGMKDLRGIHPKTQTDMNFPSYGQVFQHKIGFQNNLSALDLFFNLGRSSWDYLKTLK